MSISDGSHGRHQSCPCNPCRCTDSDMKSQSDVPSIGIQNCPNWSQDYALWSTPVHLWRRLESVSQYWSLFCSPPAVYHRYHLNISAARENHCMPCLSMHAVRLLFLKIARRCWLLFAFAVRSIRFVVFSLSMRRTSDVRHQNLGCAGSYCTARFLVPFYNLFRNHAVVNHHAEL